MPREWRRAEAAAPPPPQLTRARPRGCARLEVLLVLGACQSVRWALGEWARAPARGPGAGATERGEAAAPRGDSAQSCGRLRASGTFGGACGWSCARITVRGRIAGSCAVWKFRIARTRLDWPGCCVNGIRRLDMTPPHHLGVFTGAALQTFVRGVGFPTHSELYTVKGLHDTQSS